MGAKMSSVASEYDQKSAFQGDFDIIEYQARLEDKLAVPMAVQIAHYTHSFFPLTPLITPQTSKTIVAAWDKIMSNGNIDDFGVETFGITLFYNEFYEHLGKVDTAGKFEAVLARHVSGANHIAAKGAIIVRIIKYVCAITNDSVETQKKLYMLGKLHNHIGIRPWQYSVFVEVLLMTISSRLGKAATDEVMEAWVNMFAFVLQSMLPPALKDLVVETELNANTSSEFQDSRVAAEIAEVEDSAHIRKKFGEGSVGNRSALTTARSSNDSACKEVTDMTINVPRR
jgi:hemoglobin-like flavoprotein